MCTNEHVLKSQPRAEIDHRGNKMKEREKKTMLYVWFGNLAGFPSFCLCFCVGYTFVHAYQWSLCLLKCVSCEIAFVHLWLRLCVCTTSNDLDFITAAKRAAEREISLVLLLSSHCLHLFFFSSNRTEWVFMQVHLSAIPGQMWENKNGSERPLSSGEVSR